MAEWTTEKPTESGYYWWRQGDRIEPCRVVNVDGRFLEAWFIGESNPYSEDEWLLSWYWMPIQSPVRDEQEEK